VPAELGTVDPDEEDAIGHLGPRIAGSFSEAMDSAFHATTSASGGVAIELAEQAITVFIGPIGSSLTKVSTCSGGFSERLGPAIVDGIGFY